MGYLKVIKNVISGKSGFLYLLGLKGFFKGMDDERYLKMIYKSKFKKELNLEHPQAYTEKLQWIKLYDQKPEYQNHADKFLVREYIKETLGEEYLIPLIGVYESVEEIDWSSLPNRFVLKCTHGSGCNIVCTNKENLDISLAKNKLNKWMNHSWFWFGREWSYKNLKPRIICEEFLETNQDSTPNDYKFLCFNGEPKLMQLHMNRYRSDYTMDYYSMDWEKTSISKRGTAVNNECAEKPKNFEKMQELARVLARDTYFSRIDFYDVDGKIYFGEITYFPTSGLAPFDNEEDDFMMGSWIKLPCDR